MPFPLGLASTLDDVAGSFRIPDASAALAGLLESVGLGQADRLMQLETPMPANLLVPERARVVEQVNDGFEIRVDALSLFADPDLDALLGQEVTLKLLLADGRRRAWHGLVFGVARLGSDGGQARHRLELRPWTDLLKLRRDNFEYQDLDVQAILRDVFRDYPQASCRFDLTAATTLRPRSQCAQRDESDWDFVARLLAEEGLSFHFEHEDAAGTPAAASTGTASRHRLVVTDAQARRPDLGAIRYAQARDSGSVADIGLVDTLLRVTMRVACVTATK